MNKNERENVRNSSGIESKEPGRSSPSPLAISMWDFSWIERRWPGAGYEDWNAALDELQERGYDALRIDAFPHLLAADPAREWTLKPVWNVQDWGSPSLNKIRILPGLHEFLSNCRDRGIRVGLSTWFREDADNIRMRITSPEKMAELWIATLQNLEKANLLDAVLYVDLCNEWPGDLWCPFFRNEPPELTWGGWYTGKSLDWIRTAVRLVAEAFPDLPAGISFETRDLSKLHGKDLTFLDYGEPHIWMAQANQDEFAQKIGYKYDRFTLDSYNALVEKGEPLYRNHPDYWNNLLENRVLATASHWKPHNLPLMTTECWSVVDYKDWPLLDWGWVKDLCRLGVETAASTGRWVALATSNFCGPQFRGMWRDIEWHRELTNRIKQSSIDAELVESKLVTRMAKRSSAK